MVRATQDQINSAKHHVWLVLETLEKLHPEAVLAALDFYAGDFNTLRTNCADQLNTVHEQEISNA